MKAFVLLLIVSFAKESKSLCKDQIITKLRVLAMRSELKTNCSWKITAPNFNRLWIRVSVFHSEEENSTICSNYLKLEEIKDNKMNLLKRYCTPVNRDYIKSNSNQILLTAYNIKFKISWNGFERKETGVVTDEMHTSTEKTIFQTTINVYGDKTSYASHNEDNFIGSSSGLLLICVIGFVIKKRCCNRLNFPINHGIYKMDNLHTDITDDLDDHGNLQMTSKTTQGDTNIGLQETSKKTTRNSQVCNYGISGQVQNNESEGKIDTQGSSCMKEKKKQSVNRRRERPCSSKEKQIYCNANFTDVKEDNYWCLETPYENHLQKDVISDTNVKTNLDARHSSSASSDSADYVNLN